MAAFGQILGGALGMASPWLSAIYNSPKAQVRRLQKAGFSPNALFKMQNLGGVETAAAPQFSADFGIYESQAAKAGAQSAQAQAAIDSDLARILTEISDYTVPTGQVQTVETSSGGVTTNPQMKTGPMTLQEAQARTRLGADVASSKTAAKNVGWLDNLNQGELERVQEQARALGIQAENADALKKGLKGLQDRLEKANLGILGDLINILLSQAAK